MKKLPHIKDIVLCQNNYIIYVDIIIERDGETVREEIVTLQAAVSVQLTVR